MNCPECGGQNTYQDLKLDPETETFFMASFCKDCGEITRVPE